LDYNRLRKRTLAGAKPALNFGTSGHKALEHRYKACLNQAVSPQVEDEQIRILETFFATNPPPEDEYRNLNWAIELFVKKYNKHYSSEPFSVLLDENQKPLVELPFTVPLATIGDVSVIYMGRIDLPVLWDDQVFILDHKTTSMLGQGFWDDLRVSPQQIGYAWAFWKLTGRCPAGFCVNAIRTKQAPVKPKNGIDAWWSECYERSKEFLSIDQYNEWEENLIKLVEEYLFHENKSYFPMKKKWCCGKYGRCQYYEVCTTNRESRDMMLQSSMYVDNDWSPLNP
jgi:hypothetical protein